MTHGSARHYYFLFLYIEIVRFILPISHGKFIHVIVFLNVSTSVCVNHAGILLAKRGFILSLKLILGKVCRWSCQFIKRFIHAGFDTHLPAVYCYDTSYLFAQRMLCCWFLMWAICRHLGVLSDGKFKSTNHVSIFFSIQWYIFIMCNGCFSCRFSDIKAFSKPSIQCLLVGNKCDLDLGRQVSTETAHEWYFNFK